MVPFDKGQEKGQKNLDKIFSFAIVLNNKIPFFI